jgi:hypothetical protein
MNPHSYTHLIFDKVSKHMMENRQYLQQLLLENMDNLPAEN